MIATKHSRCTRHSESQPGHELSRPAPQPLRWLAIVAALAVLALGVASAQAAVGGASLAFGGTSASGQDLAFTPMRRAAATWYGPGLYGRRTACGQVLGPNTVGVAHRRLPCGTTVKFAYRGRVLITQVIDRGPYARGRVWDLTSAARRILGFEGAGVVHYAIARIFARR